MTTSLTYLFDPLCGWCYGASPAISSLAEIEGANLRLAPTGLFSGDGARPMDNAFATYAWDNDQRIARLTGQLFSERYREKVLSDRSRRFDSGPATLALTAVARTSPDREIEALNFFQGARFVDGRDVTSPSVLSDLLTALNMREAAEAITNPTRDLIESNLRRVESSRLLMQRVEAPVPAKPSRWWFGPFAQSLGGTGSAVITPDRRAVEHIA